MYTTFVCLYLACLCECVVMHPSVCVSCLLLLFVCVFSLCVCVHVHSSVCLVCRTITCVLLASVCVSDYTFFCVCLVCVQCVSILKCFLLKKKRIKKVSHKRQINKITTIHRAMTQRMNSVSMEHKDKNIQLTPVQ